LDIFIYLRKENTKLDGLSTGRWT